jgi:curved DNA-binding protein
MGGAPGGRPGQGYGPRPGGGSRANTWNNETGEVDVDLEDIFGSMFGGRSSPFGRRGRARPQPMQGKDVEHHINLTFEEAVWGTKLRIQLQRPDERGRISSETIEVKIPPGVVEGSHIRVRGKGDPGMDGAAHGDLHIVTHVKDHPYYRREGGDIYIDLPVTVGEAVRGGKITIPTIDGPTLISVPPGTSSGQKLRLRGKGAPDLKTQKRGDQYVEIKIVVPKKPPEGIDETLDKLDAQTGDPRKDLGWPT